MWDPVRPRNVKCGRNICHECFAPPMQRGSGGRDDAGTRRREEGGEFDGRKRAGRERKGKRKTKRSPPPISLLFRVALAGSAAGTAGPEFLNVARLLAELRVSALRGSTKFCRPAQHGDSDKKKNKNKKHSRAHQNPFTLLVRIYTPQACGRMFCTRSLRLILTSLYAVVTARNAVFRIVSRRGGTMPHFLWFLGRAKTDRTPQHIR